MRKYVPTFVLASFLALSAGGAVAHTPKIGDLGVTRSVCSTAAHTAILERITSQGLSASNEVFHEFLRKRECVSFGLNVPIRIIAVSEQILTSDGYIVHPIQIAPLASTARLAHMWFSIHVHKISGQEV